MNKIKKAALLLGLCATQHLPAATQPNVLLIITDDQGFGDLSLHGNPYLETPNLDNLANQSVRLQQFRATPVCATTRASLLTGRNHHETGVWGVHWARDYMHLDETTIADVLRDAGYDTGMIGKWHSGRAGAWLPWNRGFNNAWVSDLYKHQNTKISHNGKLQSTEGYADKALTDIAIEWIKKDRGDQPYFLLMAYMSPHAPWVAPPASIQKYRDKGCSDLLALLNGMIDHLDQQIGRLLETVDEDNTLIIFMSDNGPTQKNSDGRKLSEDDWATRNTQKMRGQKGNIWENAVRVPCFIRWGSTFNATKISALTDVLDIFPTILAAAKIPIPNTGKKLHGRSLMPLLKGEYPKWPEPRELFKAYWTAFWNKGWSKDGAVDTADIEYNNQLNAYHAEPYKLVKYRSKKPELYHLRNDPGEKKNIAEQESEKVQKMEEKMREEYEMMVASGRCYQTPRFHIGHPGYDAYKTVGEILSGSLIPFCASSRNKGNVVTKSHHSVGWKAPGDAQTIPVDVLIPGDYTITLEAKRFVAKTRICLKVGEAQMEIELPDGKGEIEVGEIELKKGLQDLTFSVQSVPHGSKEVIERMKMIHFKKQSP